MEKVRSIAGKIASFFNRREYLKVFCLLFAIVFLCFAPSSLPNGLTLPMNGDYVLQQLHFYVEGHDAFWSFLKTGEIKMWSYEGCLGVNYIGANLFYYLTSPFLIPLLFVPRSLIPQGIFIMYLVKLATGGTLFYLLLRKYWRLSPRTCLLGGLIYALSGWGMYYLWFNHFGDVLAVFPLTLIGIEKCLQKKQGWLIAVSFLLCGAVNYYFFFAWVITSFFYALFRYFVLFKENKGANLKIIVMGFCYFALGIGLAGFVLLSAAPIVLSMGRVEESSLLLDLLRFFFVDPQKIDGTYQLGALKSFGEFFGGGNFKGLLKYLCVFDDYFDVPAAESSLYPLVSFIFPPVNGWDNAVFTNETYDNTISNFYCGVPLILLFVPACINTFKSKNVWKIIGLCFMIIVPFLPISYYVLNAFAMSYGRWQLFLAAALILFTLPLVERLDEVPKKYLDVGVVIVLLLAAIPIIYSFKSGHFSWKYGRGGFVFLYLLYIVFVYLFLRQKCIDDYKKDRKKGFEKVFYLFLIETIVCGNIAAFGQGTTNYFSLYGGRQYIKEQQKIVDEIKKDDPSFYRIYNVLANRNTCNLAMTLGYKGLSTFHSVYDYELNDFLNDWSKITYSNGNWAMGVDEKRINLESFLNVKYYILNKDDTNIPFGCSLYKEYEYYKVYKNDYFVELGYAFDDIINRDDVTLYYQHFQIEPYYQRVAIIDNGDFPEIKDLMRDDATVVSDNKTQLLREHPTWRDTTYRLRLRGNTDDIILNDFNDAANRLPAERKNGEYSYFYGTDYRDDTPGDKIIIEFAANNKLCSSASKDNPCHVIAGINYGPNLNVEFYNGDELVTSDTHCVNNYNHDGDFKFGRGYFVDRPIDKIIVTVLDDAKAYLLTGSAFSLNYQYLDEYVEERRQIMKNSFQNIETTDNTIKFATDYDKRKVVVLSVPYDRGWSLKINDEEAKIYKMDAGFIGFIAPEGKATYSLNYFTPGLKNGIKVSLISFVLFLIVTLLFHYREIKKFAAGGKKKKEKEIVVFDLFTERDKKERKR